MSCTQHNHHQHTGAHLPGEIYLLRPTCDHTLGSTANAGAPAPPKPGSLREVASGLLELFVTGAKWLAAIVALAVVAQLFG